MPRYTIRRAWPEDDKRPHDYVFQVDVGRCYLMITPDHRLVWHWTVYGKSISGMEDTLAEAQHRFKQAYESAEEKR